MTIRGPNRSEFDYGRNELPSDRKKSPIKAAINKIKEGAESVKNKIRSATTKPIGKNLTQTFKSKRKDEYIIDDARPNYSLHQKFQQLSKPISDALTKAKHHQSREVAKASAELQKEVASVLKDINNNASVDADRRIGVVQSRLDNLNKLLKTDNQD